VKSEENVLTETRQVTNMSEKSTLRCFNRCVFGRAGGGYLHRKKIGRRKTDHTMTSPSFAVTANEGEVTSKELLPFHFQ